jgi:hypothetical protein
VNCFETVTRAYIRGVDHNDRIWIDLGLMNRYGSGRRSADVAETLALLSAPARDRAKALGRAMRLGAKLSASAPGALGGAALGVEAGGLSLTLGAELRPLNGALVERRVKALADALGAPMRIELC